MISSDLLVLLVTVFKTYTIKRDASRHNIKTPLVTMLLKDGARTQFLALVRPDSAIYRHFILRVSKDKDQNFEQYLSFFCSSLLCLNLLNILGRVTNVSRSARQTYQSNS